MAHGYGYLARIRLLTALVLTLLGSGSCKVAEQPQSSVKDEAGTVPTPSNCKCNDLECWRKATKDGVVAQLSCVNSALGAAANVASAGTIAAAQMGKGAVDLARSLEVVMVFTADAVTIANTASAAGISGGSTASVLDLVKAVVSGQGDALKYAFGADYTKSPKLNCLKNANDLLKNIVDIAGNVQKSVDKLPDDISGVIPVMKGLVSSGELIVNGLTIFDNCAALFTGPQDEVGKSLKAVSNAMKQIMAVVKTVFAFVDCGVGFYKGGKVLLYNTQCAIEDFAELARQRRAIGSMLAFDGSRLLNHARWAGCQYCLTDEWYNSAETDLERCRGCCRDPGNNPLPVAYTPKRGQLWAENCVSTCSAAYNQGVFRNWTDSAVCKEKFAAYANNRTGHVFRYIDLVSEAEHKLPLEEQKRIAAETRFKTVLHLETVKAHFSVFDTGDPGASSSADGLIALADFKYVAAHPEAVRAADEETKAKIVDAARFFASDYIIRQDEVATDDFDYIKRGVGKPYFFVMLETATDGGGPEGKNFDDLVGTTDVDGFIAELKEYKTESEN